MWNYTLPLDLTHTRFARSSNYGSLFWPQIKMNGSSTEVTLICIFTLTLTFQSTSEVKGISDVARSLSQSHIVAQQYTNICLWKQLRQEIDTAVTEFDQCCLVCQRFMSRLWLKEDEAGWEESPHPSHLHFHTLIIVQLLPFSPNIFHYELFTSVS